MDFSALILKMGTLFFSIMIGYAASKAGYIKEEYNKALSDVAINIATPALMISSVMVEERLLNNMEVLSLTAIALLSYVLPIATGKLVLDCLRIEEDQRGLYQYMYVFSSIGFIGYPLVEAMFGKEAMFYVTVFSLVFSLVCWTYGVQIFVGKGKYHFSWGFLKSPCIIAALLAYLIYFTGIRMPEVIADTASFLGNLASPLIMLVIGCALSKVKLGRIFCQWRIYVVSLIKMVVFPLTAYFILQIFVEKELILAITVIMLSMPIATNTTAIAYQYEQDGVTASAAVVLSTVLSLITIPLLMLLLFL